jgi:hypothetical protein
VRRRYKIAAGVARNSESHESATDSARPSCVVPETTARAAMERECAPAGYTAIVRSLAHVALCSGFRCDGRLFTI